MAQNRINKQYKNKKYFKKKKKSIARYPQRKPLPSDTFSYGKECAKFIQEVADNYNLPSNKIHQLFDEPLSVIRKLIDRNFKIRIAIKKRNIELADFANIIDDPESRKLSDIWMSVPKLQVPHPLINERLDDNLFTLEVICNWFRLNQLIKALNAAKKCTNADVKHINTNTVRNFQNFITGLNDLNGLNQNWCPHDLRKNIDTDPQLDLDKQVKLFINVIHRYRSQLEIKFAELDLCRYISIDYAQKYLFSYSESKQRQFMNKLKNNRKNTSTAHTRKKKVDWEINQRLKRLNLNANASYSSKSDIRCVS
eukprot:209897_1